MQTAIKPRIPAGIIVLERAGALEHWYSDPDGTIHVLFHVPIPCGVCKAHHCWFVNRQGRTQCGDCDEFEREGGIQLIEARA